MNGRTIVDSWWSTSSFSDAPSASAQEVTTLGEHLHTCRLCGSRLFTVTCGAEALHRFVASRFVTTLAVAILLVGACTLLR
jgi:hypothetical protein